MLKVVAGIIWNKDRQILIGRRRMSCRHLAGKWEFPGGKLELGETPEAALIREIDEEIGIAIDEIEYFQDLEWQYESTLIHLLAYSAQWVGGSPQPLAHQELAWVSPEALSLYDFAPADWQLVFNLDPHYEITTPQNSFPLPEPHS